MQLTVGKVIWAISIILVLIIMYNNQWFIRVEGLFSDKIPIIQKYDSEETSKIAPAERDAAMPSGDSDTTSIDDLSGSSLSDVLGRVGGISEADHIPEEHFEMMMEIEKLKWEMQNLQEKITQITAQNIAEDNNDTTGDVTTILVALLPIVLPYITRKYHNKEILKKG